MLLAAWFHDAVYDGERDAEERSAAWAEDALAPLLPAPLVAEVARLVRLTETHHARGRRPPTGARSPTPTWRSWPRRAERYDEYVAAVRREYAHLPDDVFGAGRAAVLGALADKPHLFHTAYAREHWEAPARANLERELAGAASGRVSPGTR